MVSEEIVALLTFTAFGTAASAASPAICSTSRATSFLLVPAAQLAGRTFTQAQLSFPTATLVGLRDVAGTRLNPPGATVLEADDTLVVIAADARSTTAGHPRPPIGPESATDALARLSRPAPSFSAHTRGSARCSPHSASTSQSGRARSW